MDDDLPDTITILHLSDIHRTPDEPVTNTNILDALRADLKRHREEGLPKPDLLVISGDITQSAKEEEFDDAFDLITLLTAELSTPSIDRVILVPGNHDINWVLKDPIYFSSLAKPSDVSEDLMVYRHPVYFWTTEERYPERLNTFRAFYRRLYGREYGIQRRDQFDIWHFPDIGISFTGFNSCDRVDHLRFKGSIYEEALYNSEERFRVLFPSVPDGWIKIAVWHHDLNWLGTEDGQDALDPSILGHLQDASFDIALCGHAHRMNFDVFQNKGSYLPIVAAGSLCAGRQQRRESIPRLYSLICIQKGVARVHTRARDTKDKPWQPFVKWGKPPRSYFDVDLVKGKEAPAPEGLSPEKLSSYLQAMLRDPLLSPVNSIYTILSVAEKSIDEEKDWGRMLPFSVSVRSKSMEESDNSTAVSIDQAVKEHRQFVLLGDMGAGKSITLQWLALQAAQASIDRQPGALIPIFLDLSLINESGLDSLMEDSLQRFGLRMSTSSIRALLRSGGVVILADGLNEIPENVFSDTILQMRRLLCYAENHFVISSKKHFYNDDLRLPVLTITPLALPLISDFVQKYLDDKSTEFMDQVQSDDQLFQMAKIPLLLSLLISIFHPEKEKLPSNLGLLLKSITDFLLSTWKKERMHFSYELKAAVLTQLAFSMATTGRTALWETDARSIIKDSAKAFQGDRPLSPRDLNRLIEELLEQNIIQRVQDRLKFVFQYYRDYYVALCLIERFHIGMDLSKYVVSTQWEEVFYIAAGLLNPTDLEKFVEYILAVSEPYLAAACLRKSSNTNLPVRDKVVEALSPYLTSFNDLVRERTVYSMIGLANDNLISSLIDRMGDSNHRTRWAASLSIYLAIGKERAFTLFTDLLRDEKYRRVTRSSAALAIRKYYPREERSIAVLLDTLNLNNINRDLNRDIAFALSAFDHRIIIDRLTPMLKTAHSIVKARILQILGSLTDPSLVNIFRSAKYDDYPLVRYQATAQLIRLGDPESLDYEISILINAKSPITRELAAQALGQSPPIEKTVKALLVGVKDKSSNVRHSSVKSLSYIGGVLVRKECLAIVKKDNQDHHILRGAVNVLGRISSPEDTEIIQTLFKVLSDSNSDIGTVVVTALSRIGGAEVFRLLMEGIYTKDPLTRERQFIILARIGDKLAAEALVDAYSNADEPTKGYIIKALSVIDNKELVLSMVNLLDDPNKELQNRVKRAWTTPLLDDKILPVLNIYMHDPNPVVRKKSKKAYLLSLSQIIEGMHSPNPILRSQSAASLQKFPSEEATQLLITALKDPDVNVRQVAASSLASQKSESAVLHLIEVLSNTNEELSVRVRAANALAAYSSEEASIALMKVLNDPEPKIRSNAIFALRAQKYMPAVESIIELLKKPSEDKDVRANAATALAYFPSESAAKAIMEAIGDPDLKIRKSAVFSLRTQKNVSAASALISILNNREEDRDVRAQAATSLSAYYSKDTTDALIEALGDSDAKVRKQSAHSLLIVEGNAVLVGPFWELLADEDPFIRKRAVKGIKNNLSGRNLELLLNTLQNKDIDIRRQSARELGFRCVENIYPILLSALGDSEELVRKLAAYLVGILQISDARDTLQSRLEIELIPNVRFQLELALRLLDLSAMGPEELRKTLLYDQEPLVRQVVARLIVKFPGAETIEVLKKAKSEEVDYIRYRAYLSLAALGVPDLVPEKDVPLK